MENFREDWSLLDLDKIMSMKDTNLRREIKMKIIKKGVINMKNKSKLINSANKMMENRRGNCAQAIFATYGPI